MGKASLAVCVALAAGIPASAAFAAGPATQDVRAFPQRVLAAHNYARARAGVPPLRWDNQLGTDAARYAVQLAITGTFAHSNPGARGGSGENLWMGTRGAFSAEAMVGAWESEKRLFARGVFPNVSRNGNWHDIGHYTQIIWPSTQRVGCALATSQWADYLVCRYSPAGNVMGTAL